MTLRGSYRFTTWPRRHTMSKLLVLLTVATAWTVPRSPCALRRGSALHAKKEFSQGVKLREESERPFSNLRVFAYIAAIGGGSIGGLTAGVSLIGAAFGAPGAERTVLEILPDLAIDLGAVTAAAIAWRADAAAGEQKRQRLARGSQLASLKVQLQLADDTNIVPLSALRAMRGRQSQRVVIAAGSAEAVQTALDGAADSAAQLRANDLLLVPVVLSETPAELTNVDLEHVAPPVMASDWRSFVNGEVRVRRSSRLHRIALVLIPPAPLPILLSRRALAAERCELSGPDHRRFERSDARAEEERQGRHAPARHPAVGGARGRRGSAAERGDGRREYLGATSCLLGTSCARCP